VPHRQQAWHLLHVQLPNVRSDSTGLTGLPILRAMVRGERDPHTLAAYRHAHGATSEEAMANAFTGNYRPAHLVARTQALELSDFYHQHITACDQAIAQQYAAFTPQVDRTQQPFPPRQRRRNTPQGHAPTFDVRRDL